MANSIPDYTKIPIPFANSGDKNTIPQNATGSNLASFAEGFPAITSQPITDGGQPPVRADFNGINNALSNNLSFLQQGGLFTFDDTLSSAIGGYAQGAVLSYIKDGKFYYLISLVNNNTYNFNNDESYIGTYWGYLISQGDTNNNVAIPIGTIYSHISKQPPEGAYLLNGQTIENCSTLYPNFYSWLVENAGLNNIRTVTASQFEQEVTDYGICNGFVINTSAGSVRLPLWKGYQTPLGNSVPVIGNGMTIGLTNGTTDYGLVGSGSQFCGSGIAYGSSVGVSSGSHDALGNNLGFGLTTDLTKSGIIADTSGYYQNDFTWCIQVFNVATTLSEQESAQLASEMQMKAQTDFGNVTNPTQAFKTMAIGWGMPDYSAGVDITSLLTAAGSEYTVPYDCCIVGFCKENNYVYLYSQSMAGNNAGNVLIAIDGVSGTVMTDKIYCTKGQKIYTRTDAANLGNICIYPLKGAEQ